MTECEEVVPAPVEEQPIETSRRMSAEEMANSNDYFQVSDESTEVVTNENNEAGMNVESVRLATFQVWPHWVPISGQRLAKAGFFYTGVNDAVECFSCGGKVSQWRFGDSARGTHRQFFPECPFMTGLDDKNVPIIAARSTSQNTTSSSGEGEDRLHSGELAQISSSIEGDEPGPAVDVSIDDESMPLDIDTDMQTQTGDVNNPLPMRANSYLYEINRLESFSDLWQSSYNASPEELAAAGFFYAGPGDRVQCAFCHVMLRRWENGDIPRLEHARHSPACDFILDRPVGDVAMSSQQGATASWDNLGIDISKPINVEYATLDSRLKSFENWCTDSPLSPEELAEAGFYFVDVSDNVKCFYCDGGLRNWEENDDPWTEHARWFPTCPFLQNCKGSGFIAQVQNMYPNNPSEEPGTEENVKHAGPVDVNSYVSAPQVQTMIEMDFDAQIIQAALNRHLTLTGYPLPSTAEKLLDLIFEIQQEQEEECGGTSGCGSKSDKVAARPDAKQHPESVENTNTVKNEVISQSFFQQNLQNTENPSLEEENRLLKEQKQCKVCMDAEVGIVFLPCGHLITCVQCAPALRDCPMCRKPIRGTVRTFMS